MDKKYQVFISSTYTDLIEERQAVIEAVLNAEHIPAGMEAFKVSGKSQEDIIRRWIEESDIYVLILGPRYGSKNQDGISYTQWEYNLAKELNKPMFSIVLTDDYINEMVTKDRIKATSLEIQLPEYKAFKEEVSGTLVHMINNIESIKLGVSDSIRQIQRDEGDNLEGWIKGHYKIELEKLRKENKELLGKLTNRQDEVIDMQKELKHVKDDYIGAFSFEIVKKTLLETTFEYLNFHKIISMYEQNIEDSIENYGKDDEKTLSLITKLKEFKGKSGIIDNALSWLLIKKNTLLSGKSIFTGDPYARDYMACYFPVLQQYNLLELNRNGGRSTDYSLTTEGKKFLSMIEIGKIK